VSIESKIQEAQSLLSQAGLPLGKDELRSNRRQTRLALALLAVANVKPETPWAKSCVQGDGNNHALSTREIIEFWNTHYNESLSPGSYDDVRRKDLIWLVESHIVLRSATNPNASTNDPTRKYAISPDAKDLVQNYGTPEWKGVCSDFIAKHGEIGDKLERRRALAKLDVKLPDGRELELTPGEHNQIQKLVIEKFLPVYGFDSQVLYVGDSTNKLLHKSEHELNQLGFFELAHDSLPDIIAFSKQKNWIYLIEAVHSSNPISKLRHAMLERLTKECTAPIVYVSAFLNRAAFKEWVTEISWETEVWIADAPDHLIHFNGDKFLGPHT
jgi:BsuBI/PstI restriction endonuclease domain/BsuBI/PstI restriction endonuclease HTH domain